MIDAGIIGGAGYTAGELVRLLLGHPEVNLTYVVSNSQYGKEVSEIHKDLLGLTSLEFVDKPVVADVHFLCSGHGNSRSILDKYKPKGAIIDLSADFRLDTEWVYGLPELGAAVTDKIANPGCFATAIQLALLPLAATNNLSHEVHVHAITGSTGAGQSPGPTTHFSWRNNNVSIYKPFTHQHLREVKSTLEELQGEQMEINFIPVRGTFTRGIFASVYTRFDGELEQAQRLFENYYQNAPFTIVSKSPIDLKQVVNTNRCVLHLEKHEKKLLITSAIDNLLKGASGQAVQNMNRLFNLDETAGLHLKSTFF